jgi:hypothetical protein
MFNRWLAAAWVRRPVASGWRLLARLVAGLVAAAIGVVATPLAASAAPVPGLVYVTASTGSDSQVYKSITVLCPVGTVPTGGGYELHGAEGSVVLDDFIPFDHNSGDFRSGVLVGAGEVVGPGEPSDGTTANWYITATAMCANRPFGYGIWPVTSPFGRGTRDTAISTCPGGQHVFGTGAALANGWGQISIASLLVVSDTSVVATAVDDEDGYSGNWSITAYAICGTALPGMHAVYSSWLFDSAPGKSNSTFCGAPNRVLGVGWGVLDWNGGTEQVINVSADITDGTGVSVTSWGHEDDNGYSGSWQVATQAICAFT